MEIDSSHPNMAEEPERHLSLVSEESLEAARGDGHADITEGTAKKNNVSWWQRLIGGGAKREKTVNAVEAELDALAEVSDDYVDAFVSEVHTSQVKMPDVTATVETPVATATVTGEKKKMESARKVRFMNAPAVVAEKSCGVKTRSMAALAGMGCATKAVSEKTLEAPKVKQMKSDVAPGADITTKETIMALPQTASNSSRVYDEWDIIPIVTFEEFMAASFSLNKRS